MRKTIVLALFFSPCVRSASADDVGDQIAAISQSGSNGKGSAEARAARDQLAAHGLDILPKLLKAMNTDNPVAANWYRNAYEEIVRREFASHRDAVPVKDLKAFVANPHNRGRVRRLALRLIERIEPGFEAALIPKLLDDREFRSEAVSAAMRRGDGKKADGDTDAARKEYRLAFEHARDGDQVKQAAAKLRSVGDDVSIIDHMGFVIDWYLLGPFDAPEKTGFDLSFPPEKQVDLNASYTGKDGREIRWTRHRTDDALGQLDLIRAIAPVKEAVGYAYTEIDSPREQSAELRCGADDNLTVWLNGEKVFTRLQWLNGTRLDRFTAPVTLKQGRNRILVKICQGPQHKNPAVPNNWSMQLRFCDSEGAGVKFTSALPEHKSEGDR